MFKTPLINYLFIFGLISNIVLPRIFLAGKFIYPSFVVSLIVLTYWCLSIFSKINKGIFINKNIHYVLLIVTSILLSYIYASLLSQIKYPNIEDLNSSLANELLLYLPFIPFFLLFNRITITERQIVKVIMLSFIIFSTIGFLQIIGVSKAVTLYSYDSHIEQALSGFRIVITGGNPNVGGIISSFFMMFFLSGFFSKKSYFELFLSFIALSLLFLTQSRTTIIGTSFVILLYLIIIYKTKLYYKTLLITFLVGLTSYLQSFFDLTYLTLGIELLETGDNASVNVRVENIKYVLNNFLASPFFGWGSSLERYGELKYLDSEILLILQRYGLYGITIILYILLSLIRTGYRFRNERLGIFILLMTPSLIFNMITNTVFYGIQSNSIIIFLLFILAFLKTNKALDI